MEGESNSRQQPSAPPMESESHSQQHTTSSPMDESSSQSDGAPSNPQEHTADAPRHFNDDYQDDPSNPIGYIRDPYKLIVYLIPFPKPQLHKADAATMPERFLIYTPPPPPLVKPAEGVKEGKIHKVQRKWQEDVRDAKTTTAKTASWKGVKSKALKGISWAVNHTTSSNLDFLGRVADTKHADVVGGEDKHAEDGVEEGETTKKTVGAEELVLIYPSTMTQGPDQIREEFVNTMLRTKTKAQREAIIASCLLPVATCIDILATPIWPFGGLDEIDAVWAYSSIRGAKTARSVTKRLSSSGDSENMEKNQLRLNFRQSERVEAMGAYLLAECQHLDPKLFPSSEEKAGPTEEEVLTNIGWSASEREKNWEDEQWELTEVKLDLKNVAHKGSKEWVKWCKAYDKNPEKALTK